ncbi:MAG TPA: hypothetical protein V6C96_02625, partial [Vampirovibrionales bacterium]
EVETPKGDVTVVSTHLENRGNPKCRRLELAQLTNYLHDIKTPLVIAGDLNTTNEEARRPYFRHAVYWYVKNQLELSTLAANIGSNIGLAFIDVPFLPSPIPSIVQLTNQVREWRNPPGLGSAERKLFKRVVKNYSFDDGTVFDIRGSNGFNQRNSSRLLANSNQSTPIGYKPTYCFRRNYKHVFCMKLDWIFVKNNLTHCSREYSSQFADNSWAPTNPRTLFDSTVLGGLSDHAAVTSDLIIPELLDEEQVIAEDEIFEEIVK